jgi:hypothetical protein
MGETRRDGCDGFNPTPELCKSGSHRGIAPAVIFSDGGANGHTLAGLSVLFAWICNHTGYEQKHSELTRLASAVTESPSFSMQP